MNDSTEAFEARVAAPLGKEAVVLLLTGTMARWIAHRNWTNRSDARVVAMHPRAAATA